MIPRVLFIDDEPNVLASIRRSLHGYQADWDMVFESDPEVAWEAIQATPFDLVVSDIRMPKLDGLQLLDLIATTPETRGTLVVMLTALDDRSLKREALDRGAVDLLTKPIEPDDLQARIRMVLRLRAYQQQLESSNRLLEETVHARTVELSQSRLDMIWRLGKAAEHRDENSANHVVRVGYISRLIAASLGLPEADVERIFVAAPLHDIGKIGIPDVILKKRGPLSPGEWAVMRHHCLIGARILEEPSPLTTIYFQWRGLATEAMTSLSNPLLKTAGTIALAHHERWDGSGYPRGISGEEIPLEARVVAVADVFDALTSRRPYKPPFEESQAIDIMAQGLGSHFDPAVYEAFLDQLPAIRSARRQFPDDARTVVTMEEEHDEADLVCR